MPKTKFYLLYFLFLLTHAATGEYCALQSLEASKDRLTNVTLVNLTINPSFRDVFRIGRLGCTLSDLSNFKTNTSVVVPLPTLQAECGADWRESLLAPGFVYGTVYVLHEPVQHVGSSPTPSTSCSLNFLSHASFFPEEGIVQFRVTHGFPLTLRSRYKDCVFVEGAITPEPATTVLTSSSDTCWTTVVTLDRRKAAFDCGLTRSAPDTYSLQVLSLLHGLQALDFVAPAGAPCGHGELLFRKNLSSIDEQNELTFVFEYSKPYVDSMHVSLGSCAEGYANPGIKWSSVMSTSSSTCERRVFQATLATAFTTCGLHFTDEEGGGGGILIAYAQAEWVETDSIFGETFERTTQRTLQVGLAVGAFIQVLSSAYVVTPDVVSLLTVVSSVFDSETEVLSIVFMTGAQEPLRLADAGIQTQTQVDWVVEGFTGNITGPLSCPSSKTGVCYQYWKFDVRREHLCQVGGTQDLNGNFELEFNVECRLGQESCPSLQKPNASSTTTLSFSTSSDNYCLRVLDTVGLVGSLSLYATADPSDTTPPATEFYLGETAYARVSVTAAIPVEDLVVEQVVLLDGNDYSITLYDHPNYFGFNESVTHLRFHPVHAPGGLNASVVICWTWNAETTVVTQDDSLGTDVIVHLRVLYQTSGGSATRRMLLSRASRGISQVAHVQVVGREQGSPDAATPLGALKSSFQFWIWVLVWVPIALFALYHAHRCWLMDKRKNEEQNKDELQPLPEHPPAPVLLDTRV